MLGSGGSRGAPAIVRGRGTGGTAGCKSVLVRGQSLQLGGSVDTGPVTTVEGPFIMYGVMSRAKVFAWGTLVSPDVSTRGVGVGVAISGPAKVIAPDFLSVGYNAVGGVGIGVPEGVL